MNTNESEKASTLKPKNTPVTRREFLEKSGAAAAGAALLGAAGCATSEKAVAKADEKPRAMAHPRVLGANDLVNLGVIGAGMRGPELMREIKRISQDKNVTISAVGEIYDRRKQLAMNLSGLTTCYHNYEDMIADPNVDGICIAVPDHWHMHLSIDAMQGGKDVYCEKPMTLYWEQAKKVAAVTKETGRVFQVGAQSTSEERFWVARELIGDGKTGILGKVLQFQTSYNRNVPGGDWNYKIFEDANEKTIDWPRWLGSAPKRPLDKEGIERFFRFRKYWDYSGGIATDLLYHQLSHMSLALGYPFPTRVTAVGGNYIHFDREVPDTFTIIADYENQCSGTLVGTSGNETAIEEMIQGEHATMTFTEDSVVVTPQKAYMAAVQEKAKALGNLQITEGKEGDKTIVKEVRHKVNRGDTHMANFVDCMRSRKAPNLNADAGYRVMMTIALGIKSYREKIVCLFDSKTEQLKKA